eukprot:CFRG5255T1
MEQCGVRLGDRRSARFQVIMMGVIALSCPGFFNGLIGQGGTGTKDPSIANDANAVLYLALAISGGFGGLLHGLLGIAAGGILGVGAGLFWTSQGSIVLLYSLPSNRGSYLSMFWIIFQLGGMLGGLMSFIMNYKNTSGDVDLITYILYAVSMLMGAALAFLFILPPELVVRDDDSLASSDMENVSVKCIDMKSALRMLRELLTSYRVGLMLPLFFCSGLGYTYHFNAINGGLFNIRTRGLNSACYWISEMYGSHVIGRYYLNSKVQNVDLEKNERKTVQTAAYKALRVTSSVVLIAWSAAYLVQTRFEGGWDKSHPVSPIDYLDFERSIIPFSVLIALGFADAFLQTFISWQAAACVSDNKSLLPSIVGILKALSSCGSASAWCIPSNGNRLIYIPVSSTVDNFRTSPSSYIKTWY